MSVQLAALRRQVAPPAFSDELGKAQLGKAQLGKAQLGKAQLGGGVGVTCALARFFYCNRFSYYDV